MAGTRTKGALFGLLGVPFLAVGIGMLALAVIPTLHDWYRMQHWYPVPATVLSVRLETRHGDDGDTWRADARYQYRAGGRVHTGTRVAINDSGADNIGDFQQRMVSELAGAQRDGRPVEVWVNPDDPADAVYNRELRPGLLGLYMGLAGTMTAVGVFLLVLAFRARAEDTGQGTPQAPWLGRAEWASPEIRGGGGGKSRMLWVFAIFWCALSAPATFAIPAELARGNHGILFVLLFDAVGLGLLAAAIHQTLVARRYGETLLLLDPHPGEAGGEVGGYFDVRLPYVADQVFRVSLSCLRTWVSGSGKERQTRHEARWQEERQLLGEPAAEGYTRVWFAFSPPGGLPVSEAPSNDYHHWQVSAHAEVAGVDFAVDWPVPVFANGPAGSGLPRRRMRVAAGAEAAAVEAVTGFTQTAAGAVMDYPAGRGWKWGLALLVLFGGGFGGAGIALLQVDEAIPRWIMGPVFLGIGLVCAAAGLWMIGNRLRVEAGFDGVHIRRWLFGIPLGGREVPRADIAGVGIVRGSSASSGGKVTQYYGLSLKRHDGGLHDIGDSLVGTAQATQAAEAFATYAGLPFLGEVADTRLAQRKAAMAADDARERR